MQGVVGPNHNEKGQSGGNNSQCDIAEAGPNQQNFKGSPSEGLNLESDPENAGKEP